MTDTQFRRMTLIEVGGIDLDYFSAERQTEDVLSLAVFTLDPPEQEGIDCADPEEITRLVVLSEVNYRGMVEEMSKARRLARDDGE